MPSLQSAVAPGGASLSAAEAATPPVPRRITAARTVVARLNMSSRCSRDVIYGQRPPCAPTPVGLDFDYAHVKPSNGDGFVNWLTTHLITALGGPAVMRTRARIVRHQGVDVCRLDVGRSVRPVWAKTSRAADVFFVRMNNSSRSIEDDERDEYIAQHWGS